MTILVVFILVIVWIAVLGPRVVRYWREGRSGGSIESFHEQLHLLGRAGPKLMPPAHTLSTAYASAVPGATRPGAEGGGAVVGAGAVGPATLGGRALGVGPGGPGARLSLVPDGAGGQPPAALGGASRRPRTTVAAPRPGERRRRGRRRRRDVAGGLVAGAIGSTALGALTGVHLLWAVPVLCVLALLGLVALAAYADLVDADRRAARPVSAPRPTRAAGPAGAGIDPSSADRMLAHGRLLAARSGYPGAWDEDLETAVGAGAHGGHGGHDPGLARAAAGG